MRRGALLALAVALLLPAPAAAGLEPGNHRVSLQHDGRPRSYIVHVPPAARDGQRRRPARALQWRARPAISHDDVAGTASAAEPTIREWAAAIGCPAESRVTAELKGQAGTKEAGHTATRYVWGPCRDGGEA
jgi:hypothetical protein